MSGIKRNRYEEEPAIVWRSTIDNAPSSSSLVPGLIKASHAQTVFIRNAKHVDGNWSGHIYVSVNAELIKDTIEYVLHHAKNRYPNVFSHPSSDWIQESSCHVSLSKVFALRSHHINPFHQDLVNKLAVTPCFCLGIRSEYSILINEYQTRAFLTLAVECGNDELKRLVDVVDQQLLNYGQPTYYDIPHYHIRYAANDCYIICS